MKILKIFLKKAFPLSFGLGSGRGFLSGQRKYIINQAFMFTENEGVSGDYYEFGVARGRTLIFASQAKQKWKNKSGESKIFGFDSFQGFPKPTDVDAIFERFKEGEEDHGGRRAAEEQLRRHRVNLHDVTLIEGWYENSLTKELRSLHGMRGARVVNIDCDMYESTRHALEFIGPLLQDGSVILFDDWFCYRGNPNRGEQRAAKEFLEENCNLRFVKWKQYANVGLSFICTKETPSGR